MQPEGKPWFSVEVNNNDSGFSKNLFYFKDKLSIPYNYLVVKKCRNERIHKGIRVMPVDKFLTAFIWNALNINRHQLISSLLQFPPALSEYKPIYLADIKKMLDNTTQSI